MSVADGMKEFLDNADHVSKVLVWVLGHMDELVQKGLLARTDDAEKLTESGKATYHALLAEGFEATNEEIRWTVELFRRWENDPEEHT